MVMVVKAEQVEVLMTVMAVMEDAGVIQELRELEMEVKAAVDLK